MVDPLPEGVSKEGALYPDGAHITDLKVARDLLYKMQRPAIAPSVSPPVFIRRHVVDAYYFKVGLPSRLVPKGPRAFS
jgi:hypothetical protein